VGRPVRETFRYRNGTADITCREFWKQIVDNLANESTRDIVNRNMERDAERAKQKQHASKIHAVSRDGSDGQIQ
jgi:hypothetical protein